MTTIAKISFLFLLLFSKPTLAQDWQYLGLSDQWITNIAVRGRDTIYASVPRLLGITEGLIFKTTNTGITWDTVLYSAGVLELQMHPENPEILFAGLGSLYPPYGIMKTTNGGETWFHSDSGIVVGGDLPVTVIAFDPVNPETLYAGTSTSGGDFYKSTNGGEFWTRIEIVDGIASIAVDPLFRETIYAGTIQTAVLHKSTDGGNTWNLTSLQGYSVTELAIDPKDNLSIYAGVSTDGGGLQKSTDGGITWSVANSGLPPAAQAGEFLFDTTLGILYATVASGFNMGGLFKSTDEGSTWSRVPKLPENSKFTSVAASPGFQDLFVSVIDSGIYRGTLTTNIDHISSETTNAVILSPTYPNPFNGSTVIRFDLAEVRIVNISVFDVLGRKVAVLAEGRKDPGSYSVVFVGSGLPSGSYFCRVSTDRGENFVVRLLNLR